MTDPATELEYNHNVVKQYGYTVDVLNITPEEAIKHCGDETKRTGRLHLWSHVDNVIVIKSVPNHIYDLLKAHDHLAETNKRLVEALELANNTIKDQKHKSIYGNAYPWCDVRRDHYVIELEHEPGKMIRFINIDGDSNDRKLVVIERLQATADQMEQALADAKGVKE